MIFRSLFLAAAAATVARAQSSSAGATATSGAGGASTSAPPAAQPSTVPVSLHATNPSAVPLDQINSAESYHPTKALDTTYAPGSEPTIISNAPPVPTNYMSLDPKNYPALDQVPPENSPEVDQWMQQVMNSGIPIPDISATLPGGCETNPSLIGNATRCWWTCGQCTTPDDITACPNKMTWGLSFDDGPSPATPQLLSYLDSVNLKSTFFIVGSRALSRPDILLSEYEKGHQLSVHTWSHTPLTTQTTRQIVAELGWTAKVIKDITGVTPNTMRPPYGDIDNRVRAISLAMGFTPIIWTGVGQDNFDTDDWHIAAGSVSASEVIAEFDKILTQAPSLNTGFIVLSHDLYQQSVDLATGYILPDALARQPAFTIQPIITCLNKPLAYAYKETNDEKSNPPPGSSGASPTGTGSGAPPSGSSGAGQGQPGAASLVAAPAGLMTLGLALLVSLMGGAPFA